MKHSTVLVAVLLAGCLPSEAPIPQVEANRCDASKIEIKSMSARFVNECQVSDCTILKGVAVLTNRCDVPIGVQLKITAFDKGGNPMATNELWPASTRNIPPGDYTFSIDQWLDYQRGMSSFELQAIDVRQWR